MRLSSLPMKGSGGLLTVKKQSPRCRDSVEGGRGQRDRVGGPDVVEDDVLLHQVPILSEGPSDPLLISRGLHREASQVAESWSQCPLHQSLDDGSNFFFLPFLRSEGMHISHDLVVEVQHDLILRLDLVVKQRQDNLNS
jgi:hypothetical protein